MASKIVSLYIYIHTFTGYTCISTMETIQNNSRNTPSLILSYSIVLNTYITVKWTIDNFIIYVPYDNCNIIK